MADLTASFDTEQFCCNAIAAAEDGMLLRWLCEEGYNLAHAHFEEMCRCLTDLHNSRRIDFFACLLNGELAELGQNCFWKIQRLFDVAVPDMSTDTDKLMAAVDLLVSLAGHDLAANQPNGTFREWLKKRPGKTRTLLDQLLDPSTERPGLLTFVLEAGATHDLAYYHNIAVSSLSDHRDIVRLSAVTALGRIDAKSDINCHLRGLTALAEHIQKTDSVQEIAQMTRALLDVYARSPDCELDSVLQAIKSAVTKESPELHCHLASALGSHHKDLGTDLEIIIVKALGHADPSNERVVDQIDFAFSRCLNDDNREEIANCLQALLSHPETPLDPANLNSFVHEIVTVQQGIAGWLVLHWLRFGNHHACRSLPLLFRHHAANGFEFDLPVDTFGFSDQELTFVCRKALGYFVLEAKTAASILVACLQSTASDAAAGTIVDLIFDPLMINFSGLAREVVEHKVQEGASRQEELKSALERHDAYIAGLRSVPELPELYPSPSQKQVQRQLQQEQFAKSTKEAEAKSVFLSIATRQTILCGSGAIRYNRCEDGPLERTESRLGCYRTSMEFPRYAIVDPVGFNHLICRFRNETFSQ